MLKEIKPTLALGFPIILGQVGQHLMPLIDTAMIGRIGYEGVAASAFGSTLIFVPMIIGFGLSLPVSVMIANSRGGGDGREPWLVLMHGLIIVTAYTLVVCAALTTGVLAGMLGWFGQEPIVVELAHDYTLYYLWSMLPTLLWVCLKNYCEAMNRPWISLQALAISLIVNVFLNWVFIFGALGAPRMEVAGAGLATLLARFFALAVLMWMIAATPELRPSVPLREWVQLTRERVRKFLALGIPSGFQILFEIGVFVFAMIAMGWISPAAQAAHQIAIQVAALAFMMPLGLSFAAGIRVGEARGRGDFHKIRRIGLSCLLLAWIFMAAYALGVIVLREWIPVWFVEDPQVQALAARFLIVAAAFAMFDATQITSLGILRGMYDVRVPTLAIFVNYWLVCAPLIYVLGFHTPLAGMGIWIALMTGLALAAVFLTWRFLRITRIQQEQVAHSN